MPPKRVRPDSSASPPPAEKKRSKAQESGADDMASQKSYLGCVSIDSSNDEASTDIVASPEIKAEARSEADKVTLVPITNVNSAGKRVVVANASRQVKTEEHDFVYVYNSDEEASAVQSADHVGAITVDGGKASVGEAESGALGVGPLLGLHVYFNAQTSKINKLLHAPVGEGFVKLSEIPEDAGWYGQQCLGTVDGRAVVAVVFGTLHFVNLQFARIMLPSLSVVVELFREADREALQRIFDIAEPRHKEATGRIQAFRAGHDEEARLLNVYDCTGCTTPVDEGRPCGINELAAGDIVRIVMRCEKVVDEDNGRVNVEFKLRRLDLVFALPRRGDIKN